MEISEQAFVITSPMADRYRDKYVIEWEKSFRNVVPQVMTQKEAEEEENEIANSEKMQFKPQYVAATESGEAFRESMYVAATESLYETPQ